MYIHSLIIILNFKNNAWVCNHILTLNSRWPKECLFVENTCFFLQRWAQRSRWHLLWWSWLSQQRNTFQIRNGKSIIFVIESFLVVYIGFVVLRTPFYLTVFELRIFHWIYYVTLYRGSWSLAFKCELKLNINHF